MGKSVRFYATDQDQDNLIAFAISKGFGLVPTRHPADEETSVCSLADWKEIAGDDPYKILLLVPGFFGNDCTKNPIPSALDLVAIQPRNAPVVELILRKAATVANEQRIYCNYDSSLPRSEECVKGFNVLARHVRGWVKSNQRNVWLGPQLAQMICDDEVDISFAGGLLKPASG